MFIIHIIKDTYEHAEMCIFLPVSLTCDSDVDKCFLGKYDPAQFIVINYEIGADSEKRHKIVTFAIFIAFFNGLITHSF